MGKETHRYDPIIQYNFRKKHPIQKKSDYARDVRETME